MYGELTRYVWAPNPEIGWGLVRLSRSGRREAATFGPFVKDGRDAALKNDQRAGETLYRISFRILPATTNTPTPPDGAYAFVCSSENEYTIWTKPTVKPDGGSRFDGVWSFPDAASAVERTGWANKENERYEGPDNPRFGTFLLTWDITEEERNDG
jgi:hypothetical protein